MKKFLIGLLALVALVPSVFVIAVSAGACTPEAKAAARTANDVAREACEVAFGADAQKQGISIKELCDKHEVVAPFIDAILSAKRTAPVETFGLKRDAAPAPDPDPAPPDPAPPPQ